MQTILPIFLIIILGAFFFRIKLARYEWVEVLNEFVVRIGFPSLILSSLIKLDWDPQIHGRILLVNSVFILSCFGLALLVSKAFRLESRLKRTLFLSFAYGNIAYIGIPVIERFLGEQYLPEASLITAVYLVWLFSVGMIYLEYSKTGEFNSKKVFLSLIKNPLIVAVLLGIIILGLQIKLPVIVTKPLEMIATSVTPVILFSIGIFFGSSNLGKLRDWRNALLLVIFVLAIKPFLLFLGVKLFSLSIPVFHASILDAAMPIALTPFALSKDFDLDANFLAKAIVLSTAISLISLSLWNSLLLGL